MKKNRTLLLSAFTIACLPGIAAADDAPAADKPPLTGIAKLLDDSGITITGYLSASYEFGLGEGNKTLEYRTFDANPDSFVLNQASATISYLPTSGFGALADIVIGRDGRVDSGFFGDGSGVFNIQQAYGQYATGNFTIIAGRFNTLSGYEVIDDSKDANISRSLVFTLAQPFFHTGIRTSYKFSDTITAFLGINNSAADFNGGLGNDDGTKQKTIESGFTLTPTKELSVGVYDYYGYDPLANPNDAGNVEALRTNLLDLTVGYTATDTLSFGLNADWYSVGAHNGPDPAFYGIALYSKFNVTPRLYTALRAEYVQAENGAITTNHDDNSIFEGTATLGFDVVKSFTLLAEGRYDGGGHVYATDTHFRDTQGDVAVKAIYKF